MKALIIGGAGFIGSQVARQMVESGCSVTIIDGILPDTGACTGNLKPILSEVRFIKERLEQVEALGDLLEDTDVVVSAFGWTSHKSAFDRPMYDMDLNLKAHVHLLEKAKRAANRPLIINLGSSVQFGKVNGSGEIGTDAEQFALDVQGIHKIAAESYYRIFAGMYGMNVYSLRIPNCFGPGQKRSGDDIGLIGSFVREALEGKEITVFGSGRKRSVLYVNDLADIISRLAVKTPKGFVALNMPAHHIEIAELARLVIKSAGNGKLLQKEMPVALGKMDFAGASFDWHPLQNILSDVPLNPLEESIGETVNYFKSHINE